jgi:hypothetical protein
MRSGSRWRTVIEPSSSLRTPPGRLGLPLPAWGAPVGCEAQAEGGRLDRHGNGDRPATPHLHGRATRGSGAARATRGGAGAGAAGRGPGRAGAGPRAHALTRAGAPDFVATTVGWRGWLVVEAEGALRLCSPRFWTVWLPRTELVALCRLGERPYWPLRQLVAGHAAPDEGCRCGIYAAATATQAAASVTVRARPGGHIVHHVIGRVSLWGTVVECERGWRAECAYPASLAVPVHLPRAPERHFLRRRRRWSRSRPAAEIAPALREYGVPVELVACETLGELAAALEARAGTGQP